MPQRSGGCCETSSQLLKVLSSKHFDDLTICSPNNAIRLPTMAFLDNRRQSSARVALHRCTQEHLRPAQVLCKYNLAVREIEFGSIHLGILLRHNCLKIKMLTALNHLRINTSPQGKFGTYHIVLPFDSIRRYIPWINDILPHILS